MVLSGVQLWRVALPLLPARALLLQGLPRAGDPLGGQYCNAGISRSAPAPTLVENSRILILSYLAVFQL